MKHGVGSIMLQGCFAAKGSGGIRIIDEAYMRGMRRYKIER